MGGWANATKRDCNSLPLQFAPVPPSTIDLTMASAPTVPVSEYAPSIVSEFPRIFRQRLVESSIASKTLVDVLPVNLNHNARLKDKYLEFRLPGVRGSLIDLSKLVLEMKLSLTKADGETKLDDDVNVAFANGTANTIFKAIQVYIGDQMVETNPYFNYWSFIKMLTSFSATKLKSLGEVGNLCRDTREVSRDTYDAAYFTGLNYESKTRLKSIKEHGLHVTFPIMSDVLSCDQYLCDDIPVRIRLELANEAWYINTDGDGSGIRSHIDFAKLWVTRLQPYPSALQSLNNQLETGKDTKTLFNKTLYKTLVLGNQQTSIVSDLPWGNVIPERLYLVMVEMPAFAGTHNKNGLYFSHANVSEITVSINGLSVYKNSMIFPDQCSQAFFNTLDSLGLENDTLLDFTSFKKGRSVFVYSLLAEDLAGAVPLEQSGNLRISIQLSQGLDNNLVILMFGDTKGVISVNADRNVICDSRA